MAKSSKLTRFTQYSAGIAAGSAGTAFVDPTGISLLTLAAGTTGAVIGGSAQLGRKAARKLHQRSWRKNTLLTDEELHDLEECIRKLSGCIIAIPVSATLSVVLPHQLIGTALSAAEFTYQLHKLRKFNAKAGGWRELGKCISFLDLSFQIGAGALIKAILLLIFLGHDLDVWLEGISHLQTLSVTPLPSGDLGILTVPDNATEHLPVLGSLVEVPASVDPQTQEDIAMHTWAIENGPLTLPTEAIEAPTDFVVNELGYEDVPTWEDDPDTDDVAAIGATAASTQLLAARVTEEPIHGAIRRSAGKDAKGKRR